MTTAGDRWWNTVYPPLLMSRTGTMSVKPLPVHERKKRSKQAEEHYRERT